MATVKELEKILKEHERNMVRLETTSQESLAELQGNVERNMAKMMEKLMAQQEQLFRNWQANRTSTSLEDSLTNSFDPNGGECRWTRIGRLDFPKFNGTNVEGWIYKCEHFFSIDRTPDRMKIRVAVVNLEGVALQWHQAFIKIHEGSMDDLPSKDYVRSIMAQFADFDLDDAMKELKALYQTGTLKEYCDAFDLLLNKVSITETQAVSLFVGGLKPEIKCMVKMFKPKSLREAYSLAKKQDQAHSTLFPSSTRKVVSSLPFYAASTNSKINTLVNANKLPLLPTPSSNQLVKSTKRLSPKEVEIKRSKGIMGPIGTRPLHILVDSGSTHNFINNELAAKLHCSTIGVKAMKVTVANGNQLDCLSLCKDFKWMMQGVWFNADVLLIPLDKYDMVLGVQWLSSLGDINWNFKNLTMEFSVDQVKYVLKGVHSNSLSLCSEKKLEQMLCSSMALVQSQMFGLQLLNEEDLSFEPQHLLHNQRQAYEEDDIDAVSLHQEHILQWAQKRWHYLHTLGFRRPRKVQEFGPCYHWINVVIGSAFGCVCRRGFPSQSTSHDAMGFEYLDLLRKWDHWLLWTIKGATLCDHYNLSLTNFFLAGNTPEQIAGLFRKWALAHLDNTSATMCDHNNLLPFPSIALTLLFQVNACEGQHIKEFGQPKEPHSMIAVASYRVRINISLPKDSIVLKLKWRKGPDKLNSILETSIEDTGQMTSRHEFTASTIGQPVTDSLVTNLQSIKTSKQIQQLTFDAQG
ncbi:hypothetical protein E3N88_23743 [Mikania micrantha]|uniref:Ty3 transposon capsid-like protein domain-containing protein n=1 Tax=Mikania micrantha TaxID=192012 RepID=A0A5N6NE64_9ASTR|nr:hypothetical protein E3N88_23743 [Mikania micrantha]